MSLSKIEKETIINFDETGEPASVYTYNAALQRKLDRLAAERPNEVKISCTDKTGSKTYSLPKSFIKVQAPRQYSLEQQEKMRLNALARFHGRKDNG